MNPASTLILVAARLEAEVLFPPTARAPQQLRVAGVGRAGDAAAAEAMDQLSPSRILNVGFAGGLAQAPGIGACVATSGWVGRYAGEAAELPPALRVGLEPLGLTHAVAATVDAPVGDQAGRAPLLDAGASIVEMEGGAWARMAEARGIPFAALRVISDGADNPLPRPRHELLRADGSVRWQSWIDAVKASGHPWPEAHRRLRQAQQDWRHAVHSLGGVGAAILDWTRSTA